MTILNVYILAISPGSHSRRRPARKRPFMSLSATDRGPGSFTISALRLMTLSDLSQISEVPLMQYLILTWLKLILVHLFTNVNNFQSTLKLFLNAQSPRNKALDICDYIMQANVDLVFLCETRLRPEGNVADCAALTPLGLCLKFFFPWQSDTGGGFAVLHRASLTTNIAVRTRDLVFTAFEICEVRLSYDVHTAVYLSVWSPPPSRQNTLTNTMFLEQFSYLLESYVSCDRLFVVGDLNVHFDKSSDPSTSAPNVILDNLCLRQLVKVPTHQIGQTSDWLIINRATDVLDLTVVDMLVSNHFVISFDQLLRKPVRKNKKIISRNVRAIDTHDFTTDVHNLHGSATQSNSTDPLVFITLVCASCLTDTPRLLHVL